jgi:hypothetical protein
VYLYEFAPYEAVFPSKVKYVGGKKFKAAETKNMPQTYAMLQVFFIAEGKTFLTI